MTGTPACTYVIYAGSPPGRVWQALTDPALTTAYWAHRNVSDWQPGSRWEHQRLDAAGTVDIAGVVIASDPPARLVLSWANPVDGSPVAGVAPPGPGDPGRDGPSRVTCRIDGYAGVSRLSVCHENLVSAAERDALAAGWAAVLSNLKTFLETGQPLPRQPWETLAGFARTG